jgi:hypothetical protein
MAPYTPLLEPILKVYKIYNGSWYWGRPSVAELRQHLREFTRKIRPDWDLFDPQLRAGWKVPDKSSSGRTTRCSPKTIDLQPHQSKGNACGARSRLSINSRSFWSAHWERLLGSFRSRSTDCRRLRSVEASNQEVCCRRPLCCIAVSKP